MSSAACPEQEKPHNTRQLQECKSPPYPIGKPGKKSHGKGSHQRRYLHYTKSWQKNVWEPSR